MTRPVLGKPCKIRLFGVSKNFAPLKNAIFGVIFEQKFRAKIVQNSQNNDISYGFPGDFPGQAAGRFAEKHFRSDFGFTSYSTFRSSDRFLFNVVSSDPICAATFGVIRNARSISHEKRPM